MTGRIFIESHFVGGLPAGAQHLYLVYRDLTSGEDFVIRGGARDESQPFGGEMEIEVNVPIGDSADNRGSDTPAERNSTALTFPGLTDDEAWSIMVKYAEALDEADIQYNLYTQNSNALVGAMLAAAGGRPGAMLPTGVSQTEALGFPRWRDIVADHTPPADSVFRGTPGADRIVGLQMDEVFSLGAGADRLLAGRGNDLAQGGAGNDRLAGEVGADTLSGGSGADALSGGQAGDRLVGGAGSDTLAGGSGGDQLTGGSAADRFDFVGAGGRDLVTDFTPGVDDLAFRVAGVASIDDLVFRDAGDNLRIDYAGGSVLLEDVQQEDLTARDILILA